MLNRRMLLAAAAAAPVLGLRAADAAAPFINAPAPAYYRFKLGQFEITVVSDGPLILPAPDQVMSEAPKPDIERMLKAARLPTNTWIGPQNLVVVNTGRNLVLFDTGMGDRSKAMGPNNGHLMRNLALAGIDPASIDVVCITHAHIDHCWGLVDARDRLNFPNARVALSQADFDFWTQESLLNNPATRDFVLYTRTNLLPVKDRLIAVRDGAEVVPGITAVATFGHTAGHHSYLIESEGKKLLNTGDVAHHPVLQLRHPEWKVIAWDSDPAAGSATRRRVLQQLATDGTPAIFYHFPFPGLGTVAPSGDAFAWLPTPINEG
ncbi:MAG: MBL fold metallo-hydrolase [Acetobacteraceae bacterium]|nr:MBL fold metallo-hydrolase [Acetobacteraceae bacterium]